MTFLIVVYMVMGIPNVEVFLNQQDACNIVHTFKGPTTRIYSASNKSWSLKDIQLIEKKCTKIRPAPRWIMEDK